MTVTQVLHGNTRDLGGFSVSRVLPQAALRNVGPFVFFDHLGPAVFAPGTGMDVRPHPHIGLATVTYLFDGAIGHRDSLGTVVDVEPGAVNWMTAGCGITHSERTPAAARASGQRMHGIQSWVALPSDHAEDAPAFAHHPAATLPTVVFGGAKRTLIAGTAFHAASPVAALSPMFYIDIDAEAGASVALPAEHEERAVYIVSGAINFDGTRYDAGAMVVLAPGGEVAWTALEPTRAMLLGGAKLDAPRHIEWNFVSASQDRIEQAKADWRAGRFPTVPGDDEFIPLPGSPAAVAQGGATS
ncbi:pirin family protein [Polymorphobacter sp. PAMC 29334]|uniref:pirin family protein n=1 Tax=Polymorphobacter sp. PAMC 29334 TaxID=2862331 RepID=UPI001C6731AA|nr:pirin family protein [Polymorphobacter sp. PAMC 29334]QYE36232.1 pirin family protein [Polymorphobacter sp. PAMC 29334]